MAPSAVPPALAVHEDQNSPRLTTDTPNRLRLSSAGPEWQDITAAQRQILDPLHLQSPAMGAADQAPLAGAGRPLPQHEQKEQAKLHERMLSWASLSAQQRNQARLNFENAKRLTPDDLLLKWQEYQALTAAEKERLKAEGLKAEQKRKAKNTRRKLNRPKPFLPPHPSASPAAASPSRASANAAQPVLWCQHLRRHHLQARARPPHCPHWSKQPRSSRSSPAHVHHGAAPAIGLASTGHPGSARPCARGPTLATLIFPKEAFARHGHSPHPHLGSCQSGPAHGLLAL